MTEDEWLAATEPREMLEYLKGKASDRKLRLFACACCRVVWESLIHGRSKQAVETAERYADGLEDDTALNRAHSMANDAVARYQIHQGFRKLGVRTHKPSQTEWRLCLAAQSAHVHRPFLIGRLGAVRRDPELTVVAPGLLREVFGMNPATPASVDLAWRTSTVVGLAEAIYAERAFDRLPILADALEEAGCGHADILAHCRSDGPHVRGCWVVDLLTGRS